MASVAPFSAWHGAHHEAGVFGEVAAEALDAGQIRAPAGVEELGKLWALETSDAQAGATQVAGDLLAAPIDLSEGIPGVSPSIA
jgi:hypothetical protein